MNEALAKATRDAILSKLQDKPRMWLSNQAVIYCGQRAKLVRPVWDRWAWIVLDGEENHPPRTVDWRELTLA